MVQQNVANVILLGFDIGANIATFVASKLAQFNSKLILVNPVLHPEKNMMRYLRSNLTTQLTKYGKVLYKREDLIRQMEQGGAVHIDGYPMTINLFNEYQLLDIKDMQLTDMTKQINFVILDKKGLFKDLETLSPVIHRLSDRNHEVLIFKEKIDDFWNKKTTYSTTNEKLWSKLLNIVEG